MAGVNEVRIDRYLALAPIYADSYAYIHTYMLASTHAAPPSPNQRANLCQADPAREAKGDGERQAANQP